jgi:hypothetical protein
MAAPLVGALAVAVARAITAQAAKQGVKKLAPSAARQVARKVIAQKGGPKAVSGKSLDRAINMANQSARSTKPVRNTGGGLRTTYSGPSRNKVSNVSATRIAEQSAGPKARRLGGESALRGVAPKPDVRITTKAGKYRGYGTLSKEKTTVTKPVKRETNKKGSAITVRKTTPRKPSDVRSEAAKAKRDRLREALTPRVNPARPKTKPKSGPAGGRTNEREQEIINRYYRIRFRDQGGPTPRSAQGPQSSVESRIASGSEKATRGRSNSSNFDSEAETLLNRSIRAIENPKVAAKERVRPGKPTKTTVALRTVGGTKAERTAKLKGTIRNQRKVLREREIKETAERVRKAEEAAAKARRAK